MLQTILRLPSVLSANGKSRSAHYLDISKGMFPKPVHIGTRSVGWPAYEVAELNSARIAGKSDDEIRALVKKLEANRKISNAVKSDV